MLCIHWTESPGNRKLRRRDCDMEHKLGTHLTSPESEIETTADEISAKVLYASQKRGIVIEVHVREVFPTKWTKNEF